MVTIQRTAATLLCVALLGQGLFIPANAEVSKVNFKFVDPAGDSDSTNKSASPDAAAKTDTDADSANSSTADSANADTAAKTDASANADATAKTDADASANVQTQTPAEGTTSGMQSGKLGESDSQKETDSQKADSQGESSTSVQTSSDATSTESGKILQGYVRVVPSGTKVPIIMDTAIDSDTSQEGDEFSARTGEDLDIDGTTVVPAGSTIRGRVAQLNLPRRMDRSGSVALKFDTVTTPDNRQIPLVANLVARGGVVHARRGFKDIAIDTSAIAVPTLAGLGIGVIAGNSSSSIGAGGGALIGAGLGVAVGVAILLAKKGKKVDVRPGDELKIELAEDLRMPM